MNYEPVLPGRGRLLTRLTLLGLTLAVVLAAGGAWAGALKARDQLTPQSANNPHPAPGDVALPMPCGLQMVFRAVDIPAKGLLWDRTISLGCDDCDRAGMEYYERRFDSAISGPFTKGDVPKAWQAAMATPDQVRSNYYFIGKYEVTGLQWKAVMDGTCPAGPVTEADAQPKADISWFDAVEFSRRYTEWLLANAPQSLPRFQSDSKNVGYVRLPTEAEWEYAARGGSRVPSETLLQEDFFPLDPGTTMADYAAFRADGNARILEHPQPIGQLRPNPLGLYDTAGNVAEMVLDPFHFSFGGRLHGSAGGFLRKGGSFATSAAEIKPGRREEEPFFTAKGSLRARDMGMRLVLSGIDTPDGDRRKELLAEWQHMGHEGSAVITGENPLKEIEKLLGGIKDPALKANLEKLRDIIKDNQVNLEKKDSENVEGLIRTAAYTIEALRSYAVRSVFAGKSKKQILADMEKLKSAGKQQTELYKFDQESIAKFEEARQALLQAMTSIVSYYKLKLAEILKYKEALYQNKLAVVTGEYGNGKSAFAKNMTKNLKILADHLALVRTKGQGALSKDKLYLDTLNPALRENL